MSDIIYGKDTTKGIVAAEVIDDYVVCLTNTEEQVYFPMIYWVLTPFKTKNGRRLTGKQHYKYITEFTDKEEYQKFLAIARKKRIDFYTIYHEIEAAMLYHGFTFYKDIKIQDVSVLAFDIEASGLVKDDSSLTFVITNTFRDREGNVSRKQFRLDNYESQGELIHEWCEYVKDVDPDILTGHNINGYDLPYLDHCSNDGLSLGRDGSILTFKKRPSNYRVDGSQTWEYHKIKCYGRCIVDGMFLAVKYDIGRNYPSWGLKPIAEYEGFVAEDRQFYDASKIKDDWWDLEKREKIVKYCEHDSDDSLKVFDLMAPSFFYMCQSIPKPFQVVTESASGSWLNAIMVRSYFQHGGSVAKANDDEYVGGGMSWGNPGFYKNVVKFDAKSYYPNTILTFELYDKEKDPDAHYYEMVKFFTNRRFQHKKDYARTKDKYYDDMQASNKVLINSAYGLMGTSGLNYNNYEIAQTITKSCRKGLQKAVKWATGHDIDYWWGVDEALYKQIEFKPSELVKYQNKYEEYMEIIEEDLHKIKAWVPKAKVGKNWKVCYKHSRAAKQDYPDYSVIDQKTEIAYEDMETNDWVLVNIDTDALSFVKKDNSPYTQDEYDYIEKYLNKIMYSEWEDDGTFDKFLVVKAKNYVMLEQGKTKYKYKGSSITDSKKEPALTEFLHESIDSIMNEENVPIEDIYNKYIVEIRDGFSDINRWCVKKNITSAVLNPERANEQKVLDALQGKEFKEGDKVYMFSDIDGEKQKITKGKPEFLKSGEPKMIPNRILRCAEDYQGTYDVLHYLDRVYSTLDILGTVVDMSRFTKYSKSKLKLLEEL